MGKVKVFCYIQPMTDIDKFYSDADKAASRARKDERVSPENAARTFEGELTRLFLLNCRDLGGIGESLRDYWLDAYRGTVMTEEGRKAAIEWFAALLSLFTGSFPPDADFPDRDWAEIRETVSAEADTLDIDLLMDIMRVIVERGKSF